MVKSKAYVEKKMRDRVSTAGKYLGEGMKEAKSPEEVILADIDAKEKALLAGLAEAIKRKKYRLGLKKSKDRDSWRKRIPDAEAHYEESADRMTENSLEDYDARAACIARGQAHIKDMPKATTEQRIKRSSAYQLFMHKEYDKLYGRV